MNIGRQTTDNRRRTTAERWLIVGVLVALCACESIQTAPLPTPTFDLPLLPTRTLIPTETRLPPTPLPADTPAPTLIPTVVPSSDGWREVRSGVQLREMYRDETAKVGQVLVVRIDPAQVDFHIRYQPSTPLRVTDWYSNSDALIVMNSSFFDQARHVVGQITTDGISGGVPHDRMEGAFYLTAVGATVWPLQGWTKPAGLQVFESVESFPMLLLPGGLLNRAISNDARAARRTAVAVDRVGRVLFIATPGNTFTLYGLAVWLANSDLDIDTALNFDGGSSTGLAVWTPTGRWGFDSSNAVPAVITVEVKVLGTLGSGDGEWP